MKLRLKEIRPQRISLSNLYILSLIITMIFMMIKGSEVLLQTSLFERSSLERLSQQLTGERALFWVILRDRAVILLALFLLSTTSLGATFVYMNVLWYGVCSGTLLTIALLRYGLKGILLLVAGVFPHYLIYVPTLVLTLQLTRVKRVVNGKFCMQLLVLFFVVITGCLVECYVNPDIVAKMLKKF